MKTHENLNSYKCRSCDYEVKFLQNYARHVSVHQRGTTKVKPFKCTFCDYESTAKHNLKRHVQQKHSKRRGFSCRYCEHTVATEQNLMRHIVQKHFIYDNTECGICHLNLETKSNLAYHMVSKHKNEIGFEGVDLSDQVDLEEEMEAYSPGVSDSSKASEAPLDAEDGSRMSSPIFQNVVSTSHLGRKLDLKALARRTRNSEYCPSKFSALIMKRKGESATALLFNSGKMVCTGSKSIEASKIAARRFARTIQKLDNEVGFGNFKVRNLVSSLNLNHRVNIERLFENRLMGEVMDMCQESFPGLIYYHRNPKLAFHIFTSGKVVIKGATTEEQVHEGIAFLNQRLEKFFV